MYRMLRKVRFQFRPLVQRERYHCAMLLPIETDVSIHLIAVVIENADNLFIVDGSAISLPGKEKRKESI